MIKPFADFVSAPLRLALVALFAVVAWAALSGLARAPEPDPAPRRWQLDLEVSGLRMHSVEVDGQPRAFYYLTYKVTNNAGKDLLFAPSFEMVANKGEPVRSGRNVPAEVTKTLLSRMQNPLLADQISIIGPLQQGAEHAREGLVVWNADTLKPESLTVYAAGFSGETAPVKGNDGKTVLLRKTRMIRYEIIGELSNLRDKPLAPAELRWIMR
jgi:hypothetical protein